MANDHSSAPDDTQAPTSQRDEALRWLAGAEKAHLDTRESLETWRKRFWAAATLAIALAIALVWVVIA